MLFRCIKSSILLIMWPTCFLDFTMVFLAYMACWIVHWFKTIFSLVNHIHEETDYMDQLGEWLQWNLKLNEILHSTVEIFMWYYIFTSICIVCNLCCYTVRFAAVCECLWECGVWCMSFMYSRLCTCYAYFIHCMYLSSTIGAAIQYYQSSICNAFKLIFNREEQGHWSTEKYLWYWLSIVFLFLFRILVKV